jgi:hypothetical protein
MKLRKIAAVLIAIVVLCAAVPNVVFAQDNFSFETAKTISLNTTTACMGSGKYVYYKFTINEPGYIESVIEHEYDSASFTCKLYDEPQDDKGYICFSVSESESIISRSDKIGLDVGTYYLLISSRYGNGDLQFDLTVNFTPANDWERERNDNVVTANALKIGKTMYGTIGYYERDYFKFEIPSDGMYKLSMTHDYSDRSYGIDAEIKTYDGTEEKRVDIMFCYNDYGQTSQTFSLSAGTYYLRLYGSLCSADYTVRIDKVKSSSGSSSGGSGSSSGNSNKNTTAKPAGGNNVVTAAPSSATESETFAQINAEVEKEASSAEIKFYGDFKYIVINVNIYICGYVGSDEKVEIPSEIDGMPVVGITDNAFAKTSAQEITVPSSVSEFGKNAFGEEDGETRTIVAEEGSPAEAYALSTGMNLKKYSAKSSSGIDDSTKFKIVAVCAVIAVIGAAAVIALIVVKKCK